MIKKKVLKINKNKNSKHTSWSWMLNAKSTETLCIHANADWIINHSSKSKTTYW
jgi:hypothetical protein